MLFQSEARKFLEQEYIKNRKSTHLIASETGYTHNYVLRALKYHGIPIRSKSTAQKNALESGQLKHPTKGRVHSELTKNKISNAMQEFWDTLPEGERTFRTELATQKWDKMALQEKEKMRFSAFSEIQESNKNGNKLELFLYNHLVVNGFKTLLKEKIRVGDEDIKCDLIVVSLNTIVFVDGVSMFHPIWGLDRLKENIAKANHYDKLLLEKNYNIIRIKFVKKEYSRHAAMRIFDELLPLLDELSKKEGVKTYIDTSLKDSDNG